jgi:3-oxoacyl-[acyl-carrier protein] reductase
MLHNNNNTRLIAISGGSRGLGIQVVKELLSAGNAVVTFSRKTSSEVEILLEKYPDRMFFKTADMEKEASLNNFVQWVEKEIGGIDGLVNNAGMVAEALLVMFKEEDMNRLLSINVKGTLLLTKQVIKYMMIRRFGRIVNISSIVGIQGTRGVAPYAATKAALDGIARSLARELGPRNITVNSVAPGFMDTEMIAGMSAKQRKGIARRTPLGRLGRADDVSGAVLYFLSDAARFTSGQTLVVDGGMTC